MKCKKAREKLSEYVDGELSSAERAAIEVHLAECAECRRELEILQATVAAVAGLPHHSAPAGFGDRLMEQVGAGPAVGVPADRRIVTLWPRLAAVAAMLLVVLGLTLVVERDGMFAAGERLVMRMPTVTGEVDKETAAPGQPGPAVEEPLSEALGRLEDGRSVQEITEGGRPGEVRELRERDARVAQGPGLDRKLAENHVDVSDELGLPLKKAHGKGGPPAERRALRPSDAEREAAWIDAVTLTAAPAREEDADELRDALSYALRHRAAKADIAAKEVPREELEGLHAPLKAEEKKKELTEKLEGLSGLARASGEDLAQRRQVFQRGKSGRLRMVSAVAPQPDQILLISAPEPLLIAAHALEVADANSIREVELALPTRGELAGGIELSFRVPGAAYERFLQQVTDLSPPEEQDLANYERVHKDLYFQNVLGEYNRYNTARAYAVRREAERSGLRAGQVVDGACWLFWDEAAPEAPAGARAARQPEQAAPEAANGTLVSRDLEHATRLSWLRRYFFGDYVPAGRPRAGEETEDKALRVPREVNLRIRLVRRKPAAPATAPSAPEAPKEGGETAEEEPVEAETKK